MDPLKLATSQPILTLQLRFEHDVVLARQRARQISHFLGFDDREQTRIATAVSEIARNALGYAGGGSIEFQLDGDSQAEALLIRISDSGAGIEELQGILEGRYRSNTGMGMGIIGAQRLMDQLQIESTPGHGTTVWLRKFLSRKASSLPLKRLSDIAEQLRMPASPFDEIKQQNQELVRTLEELRKHQEDLAELNRELEDTNRGVVALYAELDEKAAHLKQADEIKSRFLSNMSHEFRTPLNSILALARILLDRLDGDLTAEQTKQIAFISKSADELLTLVNDLLDLAKVEAGKLTVHATTFEIKELFSALRGLLKPLLASERVTLIFDDPADIPPLYTDENKVSQILRNFISNALKFTERGEIRVCAEATSDGEAVIFSVSDSGIGIASEHQMLIFQEFSQLDNPLQNKVRGTGLGLPLTRKLAELLRGTVSVKSELGVGSTFSLSIPLRYSESPADHPTPKGDGPLCPVLLMDASLEEGREEFLRGSGFEVVTARSLNDVQWKLRQLRPKAIVVTMARGEDGGKILTGLKAEPLLREVPILALTETIDDETRARAFGADACCMKPADHEQLSETLNRLIRDRGKRQILVIDDEEITRYVLKGLLANLGYPVLEARGGEEGIILACECQPQAIFLDLIMQDLSGFEVLERLAANPVTRGIPVLIMTSKVLAEEERQKLGVRAVAVLSKSVLAEEQKEAKIEEALLKAGVEKPPERI